MTLFLTALIAWGAKWLPLLLSLMPSVITGLSQVPQTRGLAATLLRLCRALSILTHEDEHGTFCQPFSAPPTPPTTPAGEARTRKNTLPLGAPSPVLGAILLGLTLTFSACSPATLAAAKKGATAGALDLGLCAARSITGQEMRTWGAALSGDDWRSVVGDVTGLGLGCVLHALVTSLSQSTASMETQQDRIERIAVSCAGPDCPDPAKARAAQLLMEGIRAGRLVLPAERVHVHRSGEM